MVVRKGLIVEQDRGSCSAYWLAGSSLFHWLLMNDASTMGFAWRGTWSWPGCRCHMAVLPAFCRRHGGPATSVSRAAYFRVTPSAPTDTAIARTTRFQDSTGWMAHVQHLPLRQYNNNSILRNFECPHQKCEASF